MRNRNIITSEIVIIMDDYFIYYFYSVTWNISVSQKRLSEVYRKINSFLNRCNSIKFSFFIIKLTKMNFLN